MDNFAKAAVYDRVRQMPYFYFLAKTFAVGAVSYRDIQNVFSTPYDIYKESYDTLEKTGLFTKNQLNRIEITKKEMCVEKEYEDMLKKGIRMILIGEDTYPEKLKEIHNAPPFIFVKGRLPAKGAPCVSVVGARECTPYGANIAKRLGEMLGAAGISVISGMARGIDSISQKACVDSGGYSLALLGGGVDIVYPKESRGLYERLCESGGIMSEIPPGVSPKAQYFVLRNRLISGVSDYVCVVEAKEKSGTMITVDCALDQGREVYAFPGRITDVTSFGTNELIREGAGVISNINTFIDDIMGYCRIKESSSGYVSEKKKVITNLSENEKMVIRMSDGDSFTLDQMSQRTGMPAYDLLGVCVSLCSKLYLKNVGAGRFIATDMAIGIKAYI